MCGLYYHQSIVCHISILTAILLTLASAIYRPFSVTLAGLWINNARRTIVCVFVCVSAFVYMYECAHGCLYVCVCVCVGTYVRTRVNVC